MWSNNLILVILSTEQRTTSEQREKQDLNIIQ